MISSPRLFFFFFFNDTATTEIYTLSLHDALPIYLDYRCLHGARNRAISGEGDGHGGVGGRPDSLRSGEHTSELPSPCNLVCRLFLVKKKKKYSIYTFVRCY